MLTTATAATSKLTTATQISKPSQGNKKQSQVGT